MQSSVTTLQLKVGIYGVGKSYILDVTTVQLKVGYP